MIRRSREGRVKAATGFGTAPFSFANRGNLTEKHEKLTQKTAAVLVRFIKKGFYAAYTPGVDGLTNSDWEELDLQYA